MPAITDVEFRQFSAEHRNIKRNWMLVVLKTDQPGLIGLGDASSLEHEEAVKCIVTSLVETYLKGKDPLDTEVHWSNLYHNSRGRGGRMLMTAIAGLDMAMWDIKGKLLDRPVFQLLGGAHTRRIRVYANGWYTAPGTPAQNADEARAVVDMGYTAMKFDPFGKDSFYRISPREAQLAEDRVAAVREAVGPEIDILIECHAKFNATTAIQLGNRMAPYRPLFMEEPVSEEDIGELAEVRRRVPVPIATGEHLYSKFPFAQVLRERAADILQPDIVHAGGLTELKKIAIMAEVAHVTMAPHNVCSPVGAMAEFHLCASIPNFEIQEYHAEFYAGHYFELLHGFSRQNDGYIPVNDAPGFGLEMDEAVIAAHPPFPASDILNTKKRI